MNKIIGLSSAFAIMLAVGCATGTPGGPGRDNGHTSIVGTADGTFTLSTSDTTLRQGETKSVAIGIKRGTNFDEDVALHIGELPQGLSIDTRRPTISHADSEVRFMLSAADDASLGDFNIQVTGHPTKGADATNNFKITVIKKTGS